MSGRAYNLFSFTGCSGAFFVVSPCRLFSTPGRIVVFEVVDVSAFDILLQRCCVYVLVMWTERFLNTLFMHGQNKVLKTIYISVKNVIKFKACIKGNGYHTLDIF